MSSVGLTGHAASDDTTLEFVYRCPRHKCGRLFIAGYRRPRGISRTVFEHQWSAPTDYQAATLPPEVIEVSPQFKVIYGQAAKADAWKLDQIAGPGYRKALEFLVKDYCIREKPADAVAIRAELLGKTITNRVTDPSVKACATRAAWLGNDETHYERRWEEKDIADLKTLIQLTMNWVVSSVLTKQYMDEMPERPKPPR